MLQLNDLVIRVGGRTLLDRANLHLPAGCRMALVGRNGTGMTTLLIERAADRLWLGRGWTGAGLGGDRAAYRDHLLASTDRPSSRIFRHLRRRNALSATKRRSAILRRAAREAEREIGQLQKGKARLEGELVNPGTYVGAGRVAMLRRQLPILKERLAEAENRWLEAES